MITYLLYMVAAPFVGALTNIPVTNWDSPAKNDFRSLLGFNQLCVSRIWCYRSSCMRARCMALPSSAIHG